MNLRPIGERALLRRGKKDERTKGGVLLSADAKEKANVFEVIALGAPADGIQIGDKVVVGKYVGTEFRWDGEDLLLVLTSEILGCVVE